MLLVLDKANTSGNFKCIFIACMNISDIYNLCYTKYIQGTHVGHVHMIMYIKPSGRIHDVYDWLIIT